MTIPVSKKYQPCERAVGAFAGIQIGDNKIISGALRCNSWTCPTCQPILKKKLFKRIFDGAISKDAVPQYGLKFLTLTYPGASARDGKTPPEMYDDMTKSFHKLITALKKYYGHFHYFRVCEPQKDGTPHFHVLLAGKSVVPYSIRQHIDHLWRDTYGMGFIRINSKAKQFKNIKHAIFYMLKYITKDIVKPGHHKRVFTCSRGALIKTIKKEWRRMDLYFGSVDDRGIKETKIDWDYEIHGKFLAKKWGGTLKEKQALEDGLIDALLHQLKKTAKG